MPKSKKKKVSRRKRSPSPKRLDLLPPEIRSIIYDFVSETLTIQVKRKWRGRTTFISRVLSLPRDERYILFHKNLGNEDSIWSPSIEKAFFIGLEWAQKCGGTLCSTPEIDSTMSEIIYELSGKRRTRIEVSGFWENLRELAQRSLRPKKPPASGPVLENDSRETKRTVERIQEDCKALLSLSVKTSASAESLLQSVQDLASQLPVAVQTDRDFSSRMNQPNPTLNGGVNIFRELSRAVVDYATDFDIYLDTPLPASFFSLYSASRFYRLDAPPYLASNLIWDFGSDIEMLHKFTQHFSPETQCYIRHVKITMVEHFMLPNETQPLNSKRSICDYINTTFPNLRILEIDLWPRDPTRADRGSREWGEQSDDLIKSLHNLEARARLRLRWAADCERFEREYVREGGWKCIWKDGPDNQSKRNAGMSYRCYELRGSGDKEVELRKSESGDKEVELRKSELKSGDKEVELKSELKQKVFVVI